MCSNTGSSACGCGDSGGGNGVTMWSSGLRKQPQQQQQQQKRPRVPKRGPGVAELEKILREQETIDITTTPATTADTRGIVEGFSSPCFTNHYAPSSFKSHHPPPPQPWPTSPPPGRIAVPCHGSVSRNISSHATSVPKFDNLGRNNGKGLGLLPPEQDLFPLNLNLASCKSKSNPNEGIESDTGNSGESKPVWFQKRNNSYLSPMMNQFLGTGNHPPSTGSLSIGLQTQIEPPSNQSSNYQCTTRGPEMAGMKRVHTSSLDNSLIPPSNFPVLPSFSRYNRPHQSSTGDNSTNECYRDAKWGSTLELSSRKVNSDTVGHGHANFPPFAAAPEVHPAPKHLFQGVLSKGNVFPCQVTQDRKDDSFQPSESSAQERKPFYNFLKVNDQEGVTDAMLGSNPGGREAGKDGIDLSLKL